MFLCMGVGKLLASAPYKTAPRVTFLQEMKF